MNPRLFTSVVSASLLLSGITRAADGDWILDGDGGWDTAGNWTSSIIADGADFTATFGNVLSADRTVTLNNNRTIGNITTLDTNNRYTITNALAQVLTLDTTSGIPEFNIAGGDLTVTAIVAGNDGIVKTGSGDLVLNAANTFTGGISLSAGRIVVFNGGNEGSMLGDSSNTLTFTGNADLYNSNGTATLGQNIAINGGVTGRLTGAFGERTQVNGVVSGTGNLVVQGFSAGFDVELLNTANTFTGSILIDGGSGSASMGVRSLADSSGTISLASNSSDGGQFEYMGGATSSLVLNSRQVVLVNNGNSGTNLSRQAGIYNNAATANTLTINTDLAITGTGNKKLMLGGGNTGDNAFNGAIIDATGANTLSLYKQNGGKWILGGINTYEGDTTVDAGTLVLAQSAEMLFMIGASGVNNGILGDATNATLTLEGDLVFDLTSASTTISDSWSIVDVANLNESYAGTFGARSTLGSFTDVDGDLWTISENGVLYEFRESTGVLTVGVIPEPSAALLGLSGLLLLIRRKR